MRDMIIGPGLYDYGNICELCHARWREAGHRKGCKRTIDACKNGKHEDCYLDDCKCECHPELTQTERFVLRKLLKGGRAR